MAEYIVAKIDEIPSGTGKVVFAGALAIALFNINGTFYALDNACPHKGGPLGEGELDDDIVSCPLHGWQFNVKTGESSFFPAGLKTYKVIVDETTGDIKVIVD